MISKLMDWVLGGSLWPLLICIAVAVIGGGVAGAEIATWRANAACADKTQDLANQVVTLTDEKTQLTLAIEKQNSAVEVARAQTEAADSARAQAELHAADLAQFSKSRIDKLQQTVVAATSCDAVLKRYWELRQ